MQGCSAEKNAMLNKAFHNTTSHFNAYYYALENINEIEATIRQSAEPNYDKILPVFASFDTTLAKSYQENTEEAIKMASLAIQRHPISKWVDDSYLLVGLARMYSLDFVNAIKTFKYVYKRSEDPDTKHMAAIYLMRTYTEYSEFDNAVAVSDILKKESLSKSNQKLLNLHRAYYYQVRGDLDNMLQSLTKAAPDLNNNDGKGRMYFIIGQNYQELGFDAEAFNYYQMCLSTNPEYELDFFARLKMAQVTQLAKNSDVKTVRKHFRKLLKDKKNTEFKDKIYYEIAEFEAKQNNLDDAIENYNLSIRNSVRNERQKGLAYLKLGKIYYDTLRNFRLAESYYDSTIQTLPTDHEDYDNIKQRQLVLKDFVSQLTTIELQDSLLILASMDSLKLVANLNDYLDEQERLAEEKLKSDTRKRQNTVRSSNIFATSSNISTNKWYFGNPSAVALGETEFRRVWGDITLEDDWRRSTKEAGNYEGGEPPEDEIIAGGSAEETDNLSEEQVVANRDHQLNQLLSSVPFSDEAKELALEQIEDAYYALGNIYHFQLMEDENAAQIFERLLERFDDTEYKIEVYYLLYLIYLDIGNEEKANIYKNILVNDFPETNYAKLILNPNYNLESSKAEEKLKLVYSEAYDYYQKGLYKNSLDLINNSLDEYEELAVSDKLKMLKILIIGKTEDISIYQYQLSQFIKNNAESSLVPFANTLLKASWDYQDRVNKQKGIKFLEYFDQEHFLVLVHETSKNITDRITGEIDKFNEENYTSQNLKTSNLILDETYSITLVSEFEGAKSSLIYYEKLILSPSVKSGIDLTGLELFTISKDNFTIFYQSKELKQYIKFFNRHYL